MSSTTTQVGYLLTIQVEKDLIMTFPSQVGDNKAALNIGLSEIHGDHIGEKEETLGL